jgi:Secretory lipase
VLRRRLGPVLPLLVVLMALLFPGAAQGAPAGARHQRPGQLLQARPVSAPTATAAAWQILYRSTTALGAPTAVSGTVLVPLAPYPGPGARPLVAYAPGTQGWGDQCAPSRTIPAGTFDEQFAVNALLDRGWAVAVTDYPGLGTPGDETYNVGVAEGFAVLDALRAALRLPGAGLSRSAPVAVAGYSQGGGAADWAAQLQPRYARELRLAGVAGGGAPADLRAVAANINGTLWFAFLAGTAIGFDAAYPFLHLDRWLTPEGRAAADLLRGQCVFDGLVQGAGKRIEDYTVGGVNPINQTPWRQVLDANNLGNLRPGVPLLQYHGLTDQIIPWQVEVDLHRRWCAKGVTTQLNGYQGDHVLTALLAQADVVTWLGDRLAGVPAPSNC